MPARPPDEPPRRDHERNPARPAPPRLGREPSRPALAEPPTAARRKRNPVPPRPEGYRSFDSTRFFSPASARSMMTFSALRLIMPSMGILTSTVRR